MKTYQEASIAVVLSIFAIILSLIIAKLFRPGNNPFDIFTSKHNGGWILLVIIQFFYLALELFETSQQKISYGVIAGWMIVFLGIFTISIALVQSFRNSKFFLFEFIEGAIYLSMGILLIYFRTRDEVLSSPDSLQKMKSTVSF
jgi:hypothetical protein